MPTISSFREASPIVKVGNVELTTYGVGAEGKALGQSADTFASMVNDFAFERKRARDASEVNDKTLKFQSEWMERETVLKAQRLPDGKMNPEFFKTDGKGNLQNYDDVVAEELQNKVEKYKEDSSNIEVQTALQDRVDGYRNQWSLNAQMETRQMEVAAVSRHLDDRAEELETKMLSRPLTPENKLQFADQVREWRRSNVTNVTHGYYDQLSGQMKDKTFSNRLANALASNFEANKDAGSLYSFAVVGGLGKGDSGKRNVDIEALKEANPDISQEDIDIITKSKIDQEEAYEIEQNPLYELSRYLTLEQRQEMIKKANKMIDSGINENLGFYRENLQSFHTLGRNGELSQMENWAGKFQELKEQNHKIFKGRGAEEALSLSQMNVSMFTNSALEALPLMSHTERLKQIETIRGIPKQSLELVFKENPALEKHKALMENSFASQNLVGDLLSSAYAKVASLNEELKKDPASYFMKYDKNTNYAFIQGSKSGNLVNYKKSLDQHYNRMGVGIFDRNIVPDAEKVEFKAAYLDTNPEQRADYIMSARAKWGTLWNQAAMEFTSDRNPDKVPFEVKVVASFIDKNAMIHALDVLGKGKDAIDANFRRDYPEEESELNSKLADTKLYKQYKKAVYLSGAFKENSEMVMDVYNTAILTMAKSKMNEGKDREDALDFAIRSIVDGNWGVVSTGQTSVFFHKTSKVKPERLKKFISTMDQAKEFARIPKAFEMEVKERVRIFGTKVTTREAWHKYLEDNAQWVTSKDGKSFSPVVFDPKSGERVPVFSKKNKALEFTEDEVNTNPHVIKAMKPWFGGH